jgi:hypothetical protein
MGGDQYRAVISTLVIESQMNHSLVKTNPAHNNKKIGNRKATIYRKTQWTTQYLAINPTKQCWCFVVRR